VCVCVSCSLSLSLSLSLTLCVSLPVKILILIYLQRTCWHHVFEMTRSAFSWMTTMISIYDIWEVHPSATGSKFKMARQDFYFEKHQAAAYSAQPLCWSGWERWSRNNLRVVIARVFYVLRGSLMSLLIFNNSVQTAAPLNVVSHPWAEKLISGKVSTSFWDRTCDHWHHASAGCSLGTARVTPLKSTPSSGASATEF